MFGEASVASVGQNCFMRDRGGTEIARKAAAQAVGAGIGLAIGGPPGAVVGAASVPLIEFLVARNERGARNVQDFADRLAEISGFCPESISAWAAGEEDRQELVTLALEVAFKTRVRRKIDALARMVADNLHDDARLDLSLLVVSALEQLESPHIRILDVVVNESPANVLKEDGPSERTWHCASLKERLPGLADGIMPLIATLFRQGLITESIESEKDGLAWESTRFGVTCLNYLK